MSERRDSNSRHPPWQGGALPAELLSHYGLKIKLTDGDFQIDFGKYSIL